MKPEFMTVPYSIKKADTNSDGTMAVIEGYAAAIGNIDLGWDRIMPGAFVKTIQEKKGRWPVLADHEPSKQIGFNVEAVEDSHGLKVKEELNLEVSLAKERVALAKQALKLGVDCGLSIGFRAIQFEYVTEPDGRTIRNIKEIKMYEHSHVTFPMNESAYITAAKNWSNQDVVSYMDGVFSMFKGRGKSDAEIVSEIDSYLNHMKHRMVGEPDAVIHSLDRMLSVLQSN